MKMMITKEQFWQKLYSFKNKKEINKNTQLGLIELKYQSENLLKY